MKMLFAAIFLTAAATPVLAQHKRASDNPLPGDHDPYDKVLVMGEDEARSRILHPPMPVNEAAQYLDFINRVANSYTESLRLSPVEASQLIRVLNSLGPELPSKYAVHFRVESWLATNLDAQRLELWRKLQVYPEYLFGYLLEPARRE